MDSHLIRLENVTKRFANVLANDNISMEISEGEIHALLGENGAGKTTLMNILSGRYQPDQGKIFLKGKELRLKSPKDALQNGIGMVHQHFMLIENLTVAENIILGMENQPLFFNKRKIEENIEKISSQYKLKVNPESKIWELSVGEQQKVEILKILYRKAKILIMDEPTAVLTPPEIEELFNTLKFLVRKGHTVIFITHKLEEVLEIANQITILRRGRVIVKTSPEHISSKRELARMMVGREVVLSITKKSIIPGPPIISVNRLSGLGKRGEVAFREISFDVRKGEIFTITGVSGNGQTELVETLVGLRKPLNGTIHFHKLPKKENQRDVLWGYIPEDRVKMGSAQGLSIMENLILTNYSLFTKNLFLMKGKIKKNAYELINHYNIFAESLKMPARQLSGGNLQKLILARELSRNPLLLIAHQPTHGLDIGATEEIWEELIAFREKGAVLLISGDLKEVLTLSDRIAVIFRGRIMDIFSGYDEEKIGEIGLLMAGVHKR